MANPIIGKITCPHCTNPEATVHREAKKRGALYYRCYGGPHGDCGTVQIRYEGGQKFIRENMRPLEPVEQDQVAEEAAADAKIEAEEAARETRRKMATEKKPEPAPEQKKPVGIGSIVNKAVGLLLEE